MRKKATVLLSVILISASALFAGVVFAADNQASDNILFIEETVKPIDMAGYNKYYFNEISIIAATNINDTEVLFACDESLKIKAYTNSKVYEIDYNISKAKKLKVYSNFLFAFAGNEILVFDIASIEDISLAYKFSIEGAFIEDFSIADDVFAVLTRNYDLFRYEIISQSMDGENFIDFVEIDKKSYSSIWPVAVTLINRDFAIIKNDENNVESLSIIDLENGIDTNKKFHTGTKLKFLQILNNKLYFLDYKDIHIYSLMQDEDNVYTITKENVLSDIVSTVTSFYAYQDKIFIADEKAKKIVVLNAEDFSVNDILNSFSDEEGRYHSPENISVSKDKIVISDTANNRVQVIADVSIKSYALTKPTNAVMDFYENIYAISNKRLYKKDFSSQAFDAFGNYEDVKDLKLTANGDIVFINADKMLKIVNGETQNIGIASNDAKKFAIDSKKQNIFILKNNMYSVYSSNFEEQYTVNLSDKMSGFHTALTFLDLYVDFSGNVFIIAKNASTDGNDKSYLLKLKGEKAENILVLEIDINGFYANAFTADNKGNIYLVSKNAHAVYKIDSAELSFATADTIPVIELEESPLNLTSDKYSPKFIEILGYPSTLFYPFDQRFIQADWFPSDMAYLGEVSFIESGVNVLSLKDLGEYSLILYLDKIGFILNDNIEIKDKAEHPYNQGQLLLSGNIYKYPVACDMLLLTSLPKGNDVSVISSLYSAEDLKLWLYVSYNQGEETFEGYVDSQLVIEKLPEKPRPYIETKLIDGSGDIILYLAPAFEEVSGLTIKEGATVKLYSYSGDFAYIEYTNEQGLLLSGYIQISSIEIDKSAERQKLGLILSGLTFFSVIAFIVIKKKFL